MVSRLTLFRLFLRTSSGALIAASVCSLASGLLTVGLLAAVQAAIAHHDSADVARYLGICAVLLALQIASRMLVVRIGQRAIYELRVRFARRVLAAPLRDLEQIGSAKVFATIAGGAGDILIAIINVPGMVADSIVILGCLGYCTYLWPAGGLVMTIALLATVTGSRRIQMRGRRILFSLFDNESRVFGHIRALVDGAKELKIHRQRREAFEQAFAEDAAHLRDGFVRGMSLIQIAGGWNAVFGYLLLGLAVFALPQVFAPPDGGVVVGFVLAFLILTPALGFVLHIWNSLGQANDSIAKIEALGLDLIGEPAVPYAEPPQSWNSIELRDVKYTYVTRGEDTPFVLGPLSLSIKRGEVVFIVGGNGSGKSTLGKVLTGLYTPDEGEIVCGGRPVSDETREGYRGLFSAVFSDFYLFEQLLGIVSLDRDVQARSYLQKLGLSNKVFVENGKLSTLALSQGQRKRLALLTAYLEDRPAYLFDEWAADQDPEFRALFYDELVPELKKRGKTVVAITHDDRYFDRADRIVKLEEGRIVQ